jgi:hypothetical protein
VHFNSLVVLRCGSEGYWHDGLEVDAAAAAAGGGAANESAPAAAKATAATPPAPAPPAAPPPETWSYRPSYVPSNLTRFYACPQTAAGLTTCLTGDRAAGTVACREGMSGVLCSACKPAHQPGRAGCDACPAEPTAVLLPWIAACAAAVLALSAWVWKGETRWGRWKLRRFHGRGVDIVVPMKIALGERDAPAALSHTHHRGALGFYQVLLLQPAIFETQWPKAYADFLGSFSVLDFQLPIGSLSCLFETNYHTRLQLCAVASTFVLLVLLLQLTCGELLRRARVVNAARSQKLLSACLVFSYLVYPSNSMVFFQTLNCREIDGVSYVHRSSASASASSNQPSLCSTTPHCPPLCTTPAVKKQSRLLPPGTSDYF